MPSASEKRTGPADPPGGLSLRPLSRADEEELRRIHSAPEVARWWGLPEEGFPWSDEPDATRLAIELDGAVAGMIQFSEELTPRYRHASIDLFLDPALHGRGLGAEAVRRVARHLTEERDHHRLTIDPATANTAAIRAYEKAGFRAVGVMRRYERDTDGDGWHDGLLMEYMSETPSAKQVNGEVGGRERAALEACSLPPRAPLNSSTCPSSQAS
jgi:aminoglycoside 6'-N-acetyltransferase